MSNVINITQIPPSSTRVDKGPPPPQLSEPATQVSRPVIEAKFVANEAATRHDSADAGKYVPQAPGGQGSGIEETIRQAARELQDYVQKIDRDLEFSIDQESGRTVITVIDPETEKIVRQIPAEETLNILRTLEKLEKGEGVLFKETV